jgi:hypothetical protein
LQAAQLLAIRVITDPPDLVKNRPIRPKKLKSSLDLIKSSLDLVASDRTTRTRTTAAAG